MKRELWYIYQEPQIILQRAACGSQAAGCPPLLYHKYYANIQNKTCDKTYVVFWVRQSNETVAYQTTVGLTSIYRKQD